MSGENVSDENTGTSKQRGEHDTNKCIQHVVRVRRKTPHQIFAQLANHVVHFLNQRRRPAGSGKSLLPLDVIVVLGDKLLRVRAELQLLLCGHKMGRRRQRCT